eukprot:scaffold944_cov115-Alexandrium_tamarense.AAC.24
MDVTRGITVRNNHRELYSFICDIILVGTVPTRKCKDVQRHIGKDEPRCSVQDGDGCTDG